MSDNYDPDDAFENGMWNSDAEPYEVQDVDYFEHSHYAEQDPYQDLSLLGSQDPYQDPSLRGGHDFSATHMKENPLPKKVRRWPWVLLGFFLVVLIAVGIYGALMYGSVNTVQAKAKSAMGHANTFLTAVKKGDSAAMQQSASGMSSDAHAVRNELQSPVWNIATALPVVGPDVTSVRTLADVCVDMADNGLVPLTAHSDSLKLSGLLNSGSVNVGALQALVSAMETVKPVIARCSDQIEALPKPNLPQVASVIEPLREKVSTANGLIDHISPLLPHLPTLFGANGQTRTYLVLAQNTAEVHATGGFVGALGTITVTDGKIDMGEFNGVHDYLSEGRLGVALDSVSVGATEEEINLFSADVDTHQGDHNLTPDFSRVGQLYYNADEIFNEEVVDGVIAFDPVFLQYMLRIVGGFETSFGVTVDGTNAAPVMLNECLFWWDPKDCDAFYSEVSKTAFHKILSGLGGADTSDFFSTVMKSADEGRCVVWMADPTIEAALQDAGFGWELSHDEVEPVTGIYLDDRSGSKSSYYLTVKSDIAPGVKNSDGSTSYEVTATFRHNMDRNLLNTDLPGYIKMNTKSMASRSDVDLYEMLYLTAPQGGRIENPRVERQNSTAAPDPEVRLDDFVYQGVAGKMSWLRIDAGETVILRYTVVTSPKATEPLMVRKTPVIPAEIGGWPA